MKASRLQYDKESYYSKNVLVGNWFEETVGSYKKNRLKHNSAYRHDFTEKIAEDKKLNDDVRNDTRIKSESGDNVSPPKCIEEYPNYFENFTTTYDLSFEYFPAKEFICNYGNLSSRNGLSENKKEEWACDVLDPRRTTVSIAKMSFPKYTSDVYKQSRWARPTPVKIKCGKVTETVYKPIPSNHPELLRSRCNPVTWECND